MKKRIEKYQNCVITLSDGSKHIFVGKAFSKKNENRKVTNVEFTYPKSLPEGVNFASPDELEKRKEI